MTSTNIDQPKRLNRQQRRARTREEILDAASTVFAQRGYHGASLDEVADAAGYTKGAVYSNFDSKEDLFLEVADRHMSELINALLDTFQSAPPGERLIALYERVRELSYMQDEFALISMEFRLYSRRHPDARDKLASRDASRLDALARALDQHFREIGVQPAMEPGHMARAVWALADGLNLQRATNPEAVPEWLPESALFMFLRGAGAPITRKEAESSPFASPSSFPPPPPEPSVPEARYDAE